MRKLFIISMLLIFAWGGVNLNANESKSLFIHGLVKQCTAVPDPKKLDYPNCLYTAEIEVYAIQDNATETISENIVLTIPIVRNQVLDVNNKLVSGDKISFSCLLYDDAPQNIREMQVADDLNLLDYENYFAEKFSKVDKLPDKQDKFDNSIKKQHVKLKKHPEIIASAVKQREIAIRNDLKLLNDLFSSHGGSLETWEDELQPVWKSFEANVSGEIETKWFGTKAYAHINQEYAAKRYFTKNASHGKSAIEALIGINKFLKSLNIDFIVVPFPDGYDLSIEQFCKIKTKDGYIKPKDLAFIKTLLENDVETLNVLPDLLQIQKEHPMIYQYPDYHPNAVAYSLVAKKIAERIARYQWDKNDKYPSVVKGIANKKYFSEDKQLIAQDDWPTVSFKEPSHENPKFLLIGDSFENGIRNFLLAEIQQNCETYHRNGGAYQLLRYLATNKNGLKQLVSAPVVIFVFDASHIGINWIKLPDHINQARQTTQLNPDYIQLNNILLNSNGQYEIKIPANFEGRLETQIIINNVSQFKGIQLITANNSLNSEVVVKNQKNAKLIYATEIRRGNDQIEFTVPQNCDSVEITVTVRVLKKDQEQTYIFESLDAVL